ncbi:membrane-bound transcription factor site-1 protease-like [Sycon ciliatum]|uniref:membrane-bound transcription factor site-1 protease-like n=1 Tax=Sycon ciliatum TaxID=27933 RepID=UPI0031F6EFF8
MLRFYVLVSLCAFIGHRAHGEEWCLGGCGHCHNVTTSDLFVEFSTDTIPGEFIVSFKGYYRLRVLHQYVQHRLISAGISDWEFGERSALVAQHPTDFAVVKINGSCEPAIAAVQGHRLVKSAVSEKKITRTLSSVSPAAAGDADPWRTRWMSRQPRHVNKPNEPRPRNSGPNRRLNVALPPRQQITNALHAEELWAKGLSGAGVRVAVFDTGLAESHPHFQHIRDRTNWTSEQTLDDGVGHGTFVAGVISSSRECFGFAQNADLYIFRVFTNNQVSYTSWFLDAFNYAILKKIHVLNLSIGGPDFMDQPFVDKVWELTANNVILVSAIGNDGPLYGTLNNPADQMDVIGVGGLTQDGSIAKFSSRGMTTWELPAGYGRVKPDIVTYGTEVRGSNLKGGCRSLSGTSVASPVVAGAVTLLASAVVDQPGILNPASMKQAIMSTASRVADANLFEQGAGKLDLWKAYQFLIKYKPHISLSPSYVDQTECPYMWPFCSQPLYVGAQPMTVNVTVLNGMAVSGRFLGQPRWHPLSLANGDLIKVSLDWAPVLWPWAGYLAVSIAARPEAANFEGTAEGYVVVTVISDTVESTGGSMISNATLPIKVRLIPTPPRHKRLLWDQYHNLGYPPGYFPRDNLRMKTDPLDWNGDHIHTNFRPLYEHLRTNGYYIEVLGAPFTCFDASQYGALMIVDPEEEFFQEEIAKLRNDVQHNGLSLMVLADWYNTSVMRRIQFFDENTKQWWIPDTGGSNIPALNRLLQPWSLAFGDTVWEGDFTVGHHSTYLASGTSFVSVPDQALVLSARMKNQGEEVLAGTAAVHNDVPILALLPRVDSLSSSGRIAAYTDSNCVDGSHMQKDCFWLIDHLLRFLISGTVPPEMQTKPSFGMVLPTPPALDSLAGRFSQFSKVLSKVDQQPLPIPACRNLTWATAHSVNHTLPILPPLPEDNPITDVDDVKKHRHHTEEIFQPPEPHIPPQSIDEFASQPIAVHQPPLAAVSLALIAFILFIFVVARWCCSAPTSRNIPRNPALGQPRRRSGSSA